MDYGPHKPGNRPARSEPLRRTIRALWLGTILGLPVIAPLAGILGSSLGRPRVWRCYPRQGTCLYAVLESGRLSIGEITGFRGDGPRAEKRADLRALMDVLSASAWRLPPARNPSATPWSLQPIAIAKLPLVAVAVQTVGIHLWVVLATGALFASTVVWQMARRARERDALSNNRCRDCGYDLTGNASGRCPECGTLLPHTMPKQPKDKGT